MLCMIILGLYVERQYETQSFGQMGGFMVCQAELYSWLKCIAQCIAEVITEIMIIITLLKSNPI